jgi:branched-chain amino acid transport system permease protein
MAEAMGVHMTWMKIVIFVYAAVLASISGFLYVHL